MVGSPVILNEIARLVAYCKLNQISDMVKAHTLHYLHFLRRNNIVKDKNKN